MANMGYCRFQNTVNDLRDCVQHWDDEELSPEEAKARFHIFRLALRIMANEGVDCDGDDVDYAEKRLKVTAS